MNWRGLRQGLNGLAWQARRGAARISPTAASGNRAVPKLAQAKEYTVKLPNGYPASSINIRLSLPLLPKTPPFLFADHVTDEMGQSTDTVLAASLGRFAVSRDLGASWRIVPVRGREEHAMVQLKGIGDGRYLAQMSLDPREKGAIVDTVVLNDRGEVLAANNARGCRWHGCRSVAMAGGTLMYAEYPSNKHIKGHRPYTSRVFRSRDGGLTWQVAFQQSGDQIRHFHFVQPRSGVAGEWWLTSGDLAHESRIWVSKDDGDSWADLTEPFAEEFDINGERYSRGAFRLTDLIWNGDEIVWGTDDILSKETPAAAIFRSAIGSSLTPRPVGRCRWHLRSLVDVGAFYIFTSQGPPHPEEWPAEEKPGVFLMPKDPVPSDAPPFVHLFDIDTYDTGATKFTASKASRAARNGTFFTHRTRADVFPSGPRMLRWDVSFS